jgi:hypothetical protein
MAIEPRQPDRLEKKKNTGLRCYPWGATGKREPTAGLEPATSARNDRYSRLIPQGSILSGVAVRSTAGRKVDG